MMECVKHINLVKVPPENSDLLLEKFCSSVASSNEDFSHTPPYTAGRPPGSPHLQAGTE